MAIVGRGMALDRPAFREWWADIGERYRVRANIGIDGSEYARFGTTFDNQIIVIDHDGPTHDRIGHHHAAADFRFTRRMSYLKTYQRRTFMGEFASTIKQQAARGAAADVSTKKRRRGRTRCSN